MTWEELKPMFRPEGVHVGVMKVDKGKCNQCGLCVENCPFRAWEMDDDNYPRMKKEYDCFSCSNCMAPCPSGAISMVSPYHVDKGFFQTGFSPVQYKEPIGPFNAKGEPDKWNAVEKMILERRSVRNFTAKPVPEPLIRRILEAGRFAPSAGNCQPWKFIVITDTKLIEELQDNLYNMIDYFYTTYMDDDQVQSLIPIHETYNMPGLWDPRVMKGGMGAITKKVGPMYMNATCLILILGDKRSISGHPLNIGICGQNMTLAAMSLGVASCWNGFSALLNSDPGLMEKLGIQDPWEVSNSMLLGYPKFKQSGMVAREYKPTAWFRPGGKMDIEK